MKSKKEARLRRARRGRKHMRVLGVPRLCVYRSPRHIYAQIISPDGDEIRTAASTLDQSLRGGKTGNTEGATKVGNLIAQRAKQIGIKKVAFDRSGYKYHGRVKALGEAARAGGLQF